MDFFVPHSPLPQHSEAVFFLWLPLLGSFKPQITQLCGRNAWPGAWKSMEFCNLLGSGNVCNIIGWKLKHCRTNSWYVIALCIYIYIICSYRKTLWHSETLVQGPKPFFPPQNTDYLCRTSVWAARLHPSDSRRRALRPCIVSKRSFSCVRFPGECAISSKEA